VKSLAEVEELEDSKTHALLTNDTPIFAIQRYSAANEFKVNYYSAIDFKTFTEKNTEQADKLYNPQSFSF